VSTASVLTLQQFMSQEQEFADQPKTPTHSTEHSTDKSTTPTTENAAMCNTENPRINGQYQNSDFHSATQNNYAQGTCCSWNNTWYNNHSSRNMQSHTESCNTPCCMHNGHHLWSKCHENPNSPNYYGSPSGGQFHHKKHPGNFNNTQTQTFFQNQNSTQNPNNLLVTYNVKGLSLSYPGSPIKTT
jgi:hypothetical protein